jgi:uncharacterized protein (DUF2141 family)
MLYILKFFHMEKRMTPLLLAALAAATLLPASPPPGTVEVRFSGALPGGPVMVQLCAESEGLMNCALRARATVHAGAAVATFENVPAGRYAVGAFQDVDSDGRLGFGPMGPPSEPWGYSRGARGEYGPPSFSDAAVTVPAEGVVIPVALGL